MVQVPLQQEILDLTRELIRIPSTHSRIPEIGRCGEYIEDWLKKNGIAYTQHTFNNIPSIGVLPGTRRTPILLMSHFDVVEVENMGLFHPYESGGRLYGRGAIDDKYAVALSLILFREHLKKLQREGYSQEDMEFGLLLSGDEEVGGANGVGMIADSLDIDFFVALDGGNPKKIVCKEKGVLQLTLHTRGKAAHGARPWLGESAFDILIEDYRKLQTLLGKKSADHWHPTAVLSNCKVGNGSANSVPDKAQATLDIRYTEREDPDQLLAEIKKMLRSEVTVVDQAPVFVSRPSPYIELMAKHTEGAELGFEHGASDARHLSQRGIPGVIYGAEGEMSQHTEEEHIVIESIYELFDRMDRFLTETSTMARTN